MNTELQNLLWACPVKSQNARIELLRLICNDFITDLVTSLEGIQFPWQFRYKSSQISDSFLSICVGIIPSIFFMFFPDGCKQNPEKTLKAFFLLSIYSFDSFSLIVMGNLKLAYFNAVYFIANSTKFLKMPNSSRTVSVVYRLKTTSIILDQISYLYLKWTFTTFCLMFSGTTSN